MIFSVLAFIALFISMCVKDRKKSLCAQALNCMFEAIYDLIIEAYTGAVLGIVTMIRSILFVYRSKFGKVIYLMLLIVFEMITVVSCYFSWAGYISLLPTIATIVRTYCIWQPKMKWVRASGIVAGILFGSYYIYYKSWFMVLGYVLLLLICIYEIYVKDIMKVSDDE